MRVSMLIGIDHVETIARSLRAFMVHHDGNIVTRQVRAEVDRRRIVTAGASELGGSCRNVKSLFAVALQTIVIEVRAVFQYDLGDRVREIAPLAARHKILY